MSLTEPYDVVAIGGAVIGSSVAYYLAADPDFSGKVLVVEKDPSYQRCASALSAAGIRQQYSSAINIQISLYGIEFLRRIGETLGVDGDRPDIQLHEGGYLFLATEENRSILEENHALQTKLGADILFLEPLGLVERFPWLSVEGLSAACWGRTGEGWFDGYGLMQAFRRKARALGVPIGQLQRPASNGRATVSPRYCWTTGRASLAAPSSTPLVPEAQRSRVPPASTYQSITRSA